MATTTTPTAAETRVEPEERVLTFGDVFGRDAGGLIVLLVLFGAMTLASAEFLTGDNMANLARQVAIFGIIAVGQLLVILTAGIDLSVGSVLGLTGCVTAELLVHGVSIPIAILAGFGVGAGIGLFNGTLVAYGKMPPFIVTLGMLGIARGLVLVLTDASTVQPLPDSFGNIANGDFLGLPNLLWMFAVVVAITAFVLRRTVFGRYIYAGVDVAAEHGAPQHERRDGDDDGEHPQQVRQAEEIAVRDVAERIRQRLHGAGVREDEHEPAGDAEHAERHDE